LRLLGVDFGGKRIGIAVGESDHGVTTARPSLAASGTLAQDAEAIENLVKIEQAGGVVLGLPENMPGKSDRMEKICLRLADELRSRGLKVYTTNEALTSRQGSENLSSVYSQSGVRKHIDGEAARLILERYFNGES
jgi:putative transcription antitermination factor YqgF